MKCPWWLLVLFLAVAAKKKHRHQKPGRALLDRLSGTTVDEVTLRSEATGGGELLPAPLDVAPYSAVVANATCGDSGTEEYCRDMPGKRGVVCDVCEGLDGPLSRRHPASHAVDGDPSTWWQSPSLATGDFGHVELVVTLPDKMELLHVIVKSGPSPRPLAWSLEVSPSETSEDWRIVRAFGDRDHCRKLWDLRPERRRRKARAAKRTNRADKPTCSTQFASPKPLENGEMHVGLGEGVTARRVRVSFRAAHPAPARQQYYTVRALTLAARCLCHGHARFCKVDHQGAKCECQHDTCGAHCQRCCSGDQLESHKACAKDTDDKSECSCGERGACSYDDTGTILCVNCTENRAGPLCDRCLNGYYNVLPDGPCLSCNCDPEGSDGSCKWDRKQHQITCVCYPGFTGSLCDACADASASFPNCQAPTTAAAPACKCDRRGVLDPAGICDEICQCKANVVGERCDACAPGHFGLREELSSGCTPCYCSHVTDACVEADTTGTARDIILPVGQEWMVTNFIGNETVEPSIDDQGKPYLISYEVEGWQMYYWVTHAWSGLRLADYGRQLAASLVWALVRGDTGGSPTRGPDVILVAADGTRLGLANSSHEQAGQLTMSAPLVEGAWYRLDDHPPTPATRTELLDVLRDVKALMLRAHFHLDQDEVRLEAVEIVGESAPVAREVCACPAGYSGPQCERCAWHHVRVPHPALLQCAPCACHGHAACSDVDGPCGECQHNTTGPHCERCLPGHYGNPVTGACKPCACPLYLPSNNFSPNCALAGPDGDEFVCTQCPDGYTGDHCENCDFGYWGSPSSPGGRCQRCACAGSPCHAASGACLACPPHAEGARCDQCQEGYWLGAAANVSASGVGAACEPCACGAGALAAACDARSGQCACRPGWAGRACDLCAPGHGGVAAGCPACVCGAAARGAACDAASGACACAAGAAPPACDVCLPHHYGLSPGGCEGCNCSKLGSDSNACDIRTGQCRCKPHVTGRACDTCEEGYWGLQFGGCRRCACGAGAAACDPHSGLCACAAGVGGAQCDTCLPGFYGFGPAGCLPCPKCSDGKVCSPDTGRCVCPARAHGPGCRQCAPGYHYRPSGCAPCKCGAGAMSNHCDPQSGECKCKPGWVGAECGRCAAGHFGARCRPCLCHEPGTRGCDSGVCPCDDEGRCPCKENVVGDKCKKCLEGTFGLSADNPSGCTACFCFGRATYCTQASLTRAALHAAAPHHITLIQAERNISVDQNSLIAISTDKTDSTIAVPYPAVPIYMELDKRFLGDRVTSYGGALRFTVEEEGGEPLPAETMAAFPLVRLEGNDIVLNHYQRIPAMNGTYAIRFHESLWEVRGHAAVASRPALMAVLQRLERVLLRASTRAPTHEHVHALVLNVSMDTAVPGSSRSAAALGVELCRCGAGYAAPSCQEPAVGFWMPRPRVRLASVAGTIVIELDGRAQPCACHGRAAACDPATGACLNCSGGTGGAQCEACAAGHYGSPAAAAGCQPCPCPSRAASRAAACSLDAGTGRLQCLCQPGYAGEKCERCAAGWYRSDDAGPCRACACDERGASSPQCDGLGRCRCRPHAAGPKCDRCRPRRTYLDHRGDCAACDNCTQTLLDSMDQLASDLHAHADPNELSRIPKPYPALLEYAHNASALRSALIQLSDGTQTTDLDDSVQNLEETEHKIFTEANNLKKEALTREEQAHYLSLESMSGLEEVLKQRRRLGEQVAELDDFARGERHLSAHRALKEAKHLLRHIKDIKINDFLGGANDVFDTANLQSTSVQEYNYRVEDTLKRVQKLRAGVEEWEKKSEELQRLADVVWAAGDVLAAGGARARPRLAALTRAALACSLLLEDINSLSVHNLTDEISSSILRSQTLAIRFPGLVSELKNLSRAAEEKEGILYTLTPVYKEKYLHPVEKHVRKLHEKAKEYKRVFAGARAAAALGVAAARAWGAVAAAVREAAAAADTARAAAAAAAAAFSRDLVPRATAAGLAASDRLKRRGALLLADSDELRGRLEALRRQADVVGVALRALGWSERALGGRPRADVRAALRAAGAQADRVFGTSRALHDEAAELTRRARYSLRRRLADLARLGDSQLGAAQEHVSQIRGNTVRGEELAEALAAAAAARARAHAAAAAVLPPALSALGARVLRARHAAHAISVSLTSPPGSEAGCARAYALTGSTPAVTRLSLAVSFDNAVRNGPLLYLVDDTEDKDKYLKLFVEKQKLQVQWDLGAGKASLSHPESLQAAHDDGDQTTYKIDIERIWNVVNLRVERMGGGAPVTASNSSAPSALRLAASRLWLGGRGEQAEGGGLTGCVHALYHDDATVGLWNFNHQPQQAKCTGCTQRWAAGGRALAWFGGAGYAELARASRRAPDPRHFSIAFTFRTRDQNALLFLAEDTANNRSVSVELRACRVVFLVQYSGARLEIVTRGSHCRGQPAHVQATRLFAGNKLERGSLRVNGEETLGSAEPPVQSAAALPELSGARYWLGGRPPAPAPAAPAAPPLLGCLGGLTVDRDTYSLFDTPARYGVEPNCDNRILRSAIFEGNGYIELPSPTIRRKSALGLTFRARAPDGLLLHRAANVSSDTEEDIDDKHYLAILLVAGELQLIAAAGKAELRLRTNDTKFDDGRQHVLRVVRAHKQLELWVDDALVARGTLAGNALPARARGLLLAGAGPAAGPAASARLGLPVAGFTGTLGDLIVDDQLIGFETAIDWAEAQLGRADGELRPRPKAEPRPQQAQPAADSACTQAASYTVEAGAVKFGDAAWSHAVLRLAPAARARDLTVSLHFRTFRAHGLLLVAPGPKTKPKHYTVLMIREGRLRLVVRGRKRKEISLASYVADGTWRSVTMSVGRNRISVSSGEQTARAHAAAPARALRLYVGGLPAPPPPRTLPPSVVRVGGLVGCVRRVAVGGRAEDLVRDRRAHRAVGQCFPDVEAAAYFGGDAYARVLDVEDGEVGEVRLKFRSAAPRGILVATKSFLLELKDGKVVLTRYWWSGAVRARAWGAGAGRGACDGAWHVLVARGGALAVDGGPERRAAPAPALHDDPPPAPPAAHLYLGGVPEGTAEWSDGGRENFKGCIKDVSVGGRARDLRDLHTHNVLLDSCPTHH